MAGKSPGNEPGSGECAEPDASSTGPDNDTENSESGSTVADSPATSHEPVQPAAAQARAAKDADAHDEGDENGQADSAARAEDGAASRQHSPALIATAIALPVALVAGIIVAAVIALRTPVDREPLALGAVPAPEAEADTCNALMPALPAELGEYTASELAEPAPPATRAWQHPDGGEPIVLRCGLDRPLEFNRAAPIQVVGQVQWFEVRDTATAASTWFAVDRGSYIALTVPSSSGPTPLQIVSETITAQLPPQPLDPGELPN